MHFSPLPLVLLAASTLASPFPAPVANKSLGKTKYVRYCTEDQSTCASVEVTGKCQSSASGGAPVLIFDSGLKCSLWADQECPKKSENVVHDVEGVFNTAIMPSASEAGILEVGSFKCKH